MSNPKPSVANLKRLAVGSKIWFAEEVRPYTIRCRDSRYLICSKPFNPKRTVLYCIVDLLSKWRAPENLIFSRDVVTDAECKELLWRLKSGETALSRRKGLKLAVSKIEGFLTWLPSIPPVAGSPPPNPFTDPPSFKNAAEHIEHAIKSGALTRVSMPLDPYRIGFEITAAPDKPGQMVGTFIPDGVSPAEHTRLLLGAAAGGELIAAAKAEGLPAILPFDSHCGGMPEIPILERRQPGAFKKSQDALRERLARQLFPFEDTKTPDMSEVTSLNATLYPPTIGDCMRAAVCWAIAVLAAHLGWLLANFVLWMLDTTPGPDDDDAP